ncbi:MAG: HAMP domain-containing sensor histidine kinase [Anaerolineae bacterium]
MDNPDSWIEIVAEVAHELKTPMTSAAGFIDLIVNCGDPLTARQEHFASMALTALERMETLVLQLLDMAWIHDDHMLDAHSCDVCVVIDRAISHITDLAQRQQVTIHTEFDAEVGHIESNERVLEQVLLNLLSNAVKYNQPNGEVWVRATALAESIEVSVRDNGRGISAEALPRVFDRFFREVKDKRIEGTGLGLAIVKSLIEKHGGHIWVTSEPNQGATFTFVLPRVLRQIEGQVSDREADTIPAESGETWLDEREGSHEELDSVDDNYQEPPSPRVEQDQDDLAEQQ